jgi:hypothetical protein
VGAPALFSRFRACERKAKKRKSAKIKEREKSESPERERKKLAFALFLPCRATLETWFQSPNPLGRKVKQGY